MFETVLVANRGEIACRVISTLHRLGIKAVAVHSEADVNAAHVRAADTSVLLGGPAPADSYLDVAKIVEAAQRSGAEAVHPGYGFLSESVELARAVEAAGLVWIGPPAEAMAAMADKIDARNTVHAAGVPVAPGTEQPLTDVENAVWCAEAIGYPVMVKASAGGGGIGMAVAHDVAGLRTTFETATTRAARFFGSPSILLEKFVARARHVEVQVLGLADGTVVALGERDCSVQRRHQKVAEESPSPGLDPAIRERMLAAAVAAAEAVGYRGAGTVEFLLDRDATDPAEAFFFMEMNCRLQVEHPVTEMVTGLDLVEAQLRVAAGEEVDLSGPRPGGHAIELRVYAEDPKRFLPGPGTISRWSQPAGEGVRVDAGYAEGDVVTPFYDPLMAKLVVWGVDRDQALERARSAVEGFAVEGPKCNLPFFLELLDDAEFVSGEYDTGLIARMRAPK